jgi:PelA/Pel-15E family pectate lyase
MTTRIALTLACLIQVLAPPAASAQASLSEELHVAMKRASSFFHNQVASHGGYVYHYSLDLQQRWGEGVATRDQIWVQPPGTPTVGLAYLTAYQATGDPDYLVAATDAAMALVYGQLRSGGWTNAIDFDPKGELVADYLNGHGRGKNHSSLDDGQTPSAIRLLVRVDEALGFKNATIHQAAIRSLDALLAAQFPNGGFPQVWTDSVTVQPILKASYPDYDWKTEGRVKNYWDMYTLNDNVPGYVAEALLEAYNVYADPRYLDSLRRLGEFLILAQMPEPQPGWAQQYGYDMRPIWARKFEPPGVCGDETQEAIATLIKISQATGDHRFLEPIPAAIQWLRQSQLPDGQCARYYELESNRPLYMTRSGDTYSLTYEDANLPDHYGWKVPCRVDELEKQSELVRTGATLENESEQAVQESEAKSIIAALDEKGRWVSTYDGTPLIGQLKLPPGTPYLSSQVFSRNLELLSRYLIQQTHADDRTRL